ncbi:uncharacterized protein TNIN_401191 [Trichonephila inaurata madagascariensis]|uniref:Uncharacterized protein n=1 Tax=Trichonephila inaurata madagascariensis TaxID=2747483 RepID=A0A8X6WP97_9ARAC|nr:uncharacterized protein TNIN_401191 [Trichonephila inaurata madagascariensis]
MAMKWLTFSPRKTPLRFQCQVTPWHSLRSAPKSESQISSCRKLSRLIRDTIGKPQVIPLPSKWIESSSPPSPDLQFRLGKKKRRTCTDPANCFQCMQRNVNLNASQYTMNTFLEKERRLAEEAKRKEPHFVQLPPERKQKPIPEESSSGSGSIPSPVPAPAPVSGRRVVVASCSRNPCIVTRVEAPDDEVLVQLPLQYHSPHCNCAACKKKRYDDSLIAMDAQVILQNSLLQSSLTDTAGLVCAIL